MMTYDAFLTALLKQSEDAAKESYKLSPHKLEGSLIAFKACSCKTPSELLELLTEANNRVDESFARQDENHVYWRLRTYAAELDWICNCVSCALVNVGAEPIIPPTARGLLAAAEVLGTATLQN